MKTTDDFKYYERHKPIKYKFIESFVKNKINDINFIYDVGCNNGDISYPLQKKFNLDVSGIDLSDNLIVPDDYKFNKVDIVNENKIYYNDCTLFLSLYHHILGAYDLKVADNIFLKLLLRTKYLIFDAGNLSELNRSNTYWYKIQKKYFKTENDMLNHFHLKFDVIGSWNVANGSRDVVVYNSEYFDDVVEVVGEFRRLIGSEYQHIGLASHVDEELYDGKGHNGKVYGGTKYYKLKYNNTFYFSKKHLIKENEIIEKENISKIYSSIDKDKLLNYIGFSVKYGFIYEWIDNFKYIEKTIIKNDVIELNDVDLIMINGKNKFIDFHN